ncbi:MAG: nicotinate (nicotinamide) nucleotide adenylyltransferase [Gemmiger sp.]|nr:nicotinate (nicotinamide) nucleotide adenylyltransferase [Gemmiger sp.]
MMRLLLYGGTFDPPHNGHMNNLKAAMAAVQPGHVVVMPAGIPPHKAASATPAEYRLAMCRCFAALGAEVEVSDWEIRQGGRSYTVDTLAMLKKQWPGAHLYLAIGSDMLLGFTKWRRWQDILRLATLVVQSRQPGDAPTLKAAAKALRRAGGHIRFAGAAPYPCASHELRAGRYTPAQRQKLLPPPVPEIIEKYNLYNMSAI